MKVDTPMISWHCKEPLLSVNHGPNGLIATAASDHTVKIWRFIKPFNELALTPHQQIQAQKQPNAGSRFVIAQQTLDASTVKFVANISRHDRTVNCVRFSPEGDLLASGADDGIIYVWKKSEEQVDANAFSNDDDAYAEEKWVVVHTLRGHVADIYDLEWSSDSKRLLSGSIDNEVIVWDLESNPPRASQRIVDHTGYVQGVAWDPERKFIVSQSSDRSCRIYSFHANKKGVFNIYRVLRKRESWKEAPEETSTPGKKTPDIADADGASSNVASQVMFLDDTVRSFFRRLTWSPDASFLFIPAGHFRPLNDQEKAACPDTDVSSFRVVYVFSRSNLRSPIAALPCREPPIVIRCSPILYQKDSDATDHPLSSVPYKLVFAVATPSKVILYNNLSPVPIAIISNIHLASITDLSWSRDGLCLAVSSVDGYISFVYFETDELGKPLSEKERKEFEASLAHRRNENVTPAKKKSTKKSSQSKKGLKASKAAKQKLEESGVVMTDSSSDQQRKTGKGAKSKKPVQGPGPMQRSILELVSRDGATPPKPKKRRIAPTTPTPMPANSAQTEQSKAPRRITPIVVANPSSLSGLSSTQVPSGLSPTAASSEPKAQEATAPTKRRITPVTLLPSTQPTSAQSIEVKEPAAKKPRKVTPTLIFPPPTQQ